MPARSWLLGNKMLATYPFAFKHVFRLRVSTDHFYLFFSPLCIQFFFKFSLLDNTEGIRKNPISLSRSLLLPQHKTTQRTDLSLLSYCDLSIERVCLGTNMADRQMPREWKPRIGLTKKNEQKRNKRMYGYKSKRGKHNTYFRIQTRV